MSAKPTQQTIDLMIDLYQQGLSSETIGKRIIFKASQNWQTFS